MSNSRHYGYVVATILLLLTSLRVTAQTPNWCVSVWYPSSAEPTGRESLLNHLSQLDIVHPFWYTPNADLTLQAVRGAEDQELMNQWRTEGVVVLPSIFASIPSMLASEDDMDFHIQEILALVDRMDYDGIDIDYEGFPANTKDAFSVFIQNLSQALKSRGKLLSIAVHAKFTDEGAWEGASAQDWYAIAPFVDIFTIMTYDYTNRNEPPNAIAPTNWVLDVVEYAESVMSLDKVRVGLHFYGYSWLRDRPPATTVTWEAAQRLIESFGLVVERDLDNKEAMIAFKVQGLPKQTIYFADAIHLADKLERLKEAFPTLGGVAIWGIGGEDPQNWDIIEQARNNACTLKRN